MTKIIQTSFSAGELSRSLYGRTDLSKYHIGAALMRNFFVDYRGGGSTRPGTRFVSLAANSNLPVRLIRFQFSTIQQYILEFGQQYMRVHFNGAPVLEATKTITGITNAFPPVVTTSGAHGYTTGDSVYIDNVSGMVEINQGTYIVTVLSATTFDLTNPFTGQAVNAVNYGAYTAGGTVARVYTLATPYVATDLAKLKFTQSADTMTLTHTSYAPRDLTRTAHAAWTLTPISFSATLPNPTAIFLSASSAGTATYTYEVTAVASDGSESTPAGPAQLGSAVNISTTAGSISVSWTQVAGAIYYKVYRATIQPVAAGTNSLGQPVGYVGTSFGNAFQDNNIIPDFTQSPPTHYDPFAIGPVTGVFVTAAGSGYSNSSVVSFTGGGGSGAAGYVVVVGAGLLASIVVTNPGSGYTSAPAVSVSGGTGATFSVTIGPTTGTWPGCVTYFQQRKVFAATQNAPQSLWGTKPGAYRNMDYSIPISDGDSYGFTVSSNQVNAIKAMVAMPGGLVLFTASGVWQLKGAGNSGTAVTPTSAEANPQAYTGCSDVPPIPINYDILYVQDKGSIVRDLSYNFFANIYTSEDRSFLSNHLFSPHYITEWTYAEEPFKVIWGCREDGIALGFTFMREQEVFGWCWADTQGQFSSVASIQEGKADAVYWVVKRYVGGRWLQFIERMEQRFAGRAQEIEKAWCVDCGLAYIGSTPAADLTVSVSGVAATVTASANVFSAGNVGSILRMNGGKITVTNYISPTQIVGNIDPQYPLLDLMPITGIPYPALSGSWTIGAPVTILRGLTHLEGQTVQIYADGNVKPSQVVTNGTVTLNVAASYVIVGLQFIAQMATMPVDSGTPTMQGYRKSIDQATLMVSASRGLRVGPSLTQLQEIKQERAFMGKALDAFSGDLFMNLDPKWDQYGQIFIQQDYPLPATVLAVVPDVDIGDT
jgi:hypothetical protein